MSRSRKQAWFLAITLATPFLLLLALEGGLRLAWRDGHLPLFVRAPIGRGEYLIANPRVARRWFAREQAPPAPMPEPFLAQKPERGFRVFVLGESSAAGFPYPRNATFSRLLRDVLADALPGDSVEVVNLGIAATNSYALVDVAGEVLEQRPDAVLIYAGHNEWYGVLGAGASEALAATPSLVRLTLRAQRWRTFLALRQGVAWMREKIAGSPRAALESASFMETLAREREITLGGDAYQRGVRQFASNLDVLVSRLRQANVPVFVASVGSNLRDQAPFASSANGAHDGADSTFARAGMLLAQGDTAGARREYVRARDLDVVRFRAPSVFDSIVRTVAGASGAVYVSAAERFASESPAGIPGRELFLEHVHPNTRGYGLLAHAFFEAMRDARVPARLRDASVRPWAEYERARHLSPFDTLIAEHTRRTLTVRWPFVSTDRQQDYRAAYRPTGVMDSLAFAVSRGERWELAKLRLAEHYERAGALDSAILEYRGLARDAPFFETPHRLLGRALTEAGRVDEAEVALRRALAIQPTAPTAHALALIALRRRDTADGIRLLELALRLEPTRPDAWYQLAVARGMAQDIAGARTAAMQLARLAPDHPGLPGLLRALGLDEQPGRRR